MNTSKRILLVTWDGGGNLEPELVLMRGLIRRGHQVRVLGDPTLEAEVRGAGCDFSPWTTAPHRTSRARHTDLVKDYEFKNPLKMLEMYMRDFLAAPAARWVKDTLDELQKHPADLLLADFAVPSALIAAERLGLPTATLMPNIWVIPTPGIPPLGPGFMPAKGIFGRLRDWLFYTLTRRAFSKGLPAFNAVRQQYGLQPRRDVYEQLLAADRILVQTSPHFDFTSEHIPKHVQYVGPALADPQWSVPTTHSVGRPAWLAPFAETDTRPLVLVGLSSTFQDQVPTLRRVIQALSKLDVRAVVTLGPALSASEVPTAQNVCIVETAPHTEILKQATLLITHCGHGTTMKGLVAGVPLVCIPMGRDQNDNAARVVHAHAGVRLTPAASEHSIRDAIQRVLGDPTFTAGARRLQRAIQSKDGCMDPIAVIESLTAASLRAAA